MSWRYQTWFGDFGLGPALSLDTDGHGRMDKVHRRARPPVHKKHQPVLIPTLLTWLFVSRGALKRNSLLILALLGTNPAMCMFQNAISPVGKAKSRRQRSCAVNKTGTVAVRGYRLRVKDVNFQVFVQWTNLTTSTSSVRADPEVTVYGKTFYCEAYSTLQSRDLWTRK